MFRSFAAALAATLALCACATTTSNNSQPAEEKEYRTGSNIPVRDRSAPSQARTVNPQEINRTPGAGARPGSPN